MAFRSTALNYALRFCPYALDLWESGTQHDKGGFQQGIAAHSVAQEFTNRARYGEFDHKLTAASVVEHLVTKGHQFERVTEPPMHPEDAWAGAEIALEYFAKVPVNDSAEAEVGLAVDADWKPVEYDSPRAYWKAILDRRYSYLMDDDDDGTSLSGQVASDYKTAFSTGPDECDTIQMKGQALVLAAHYPDEDFYIREVINMRTGAAYRQSTFNDATGKAEMASWRTRIQSAIRYAEVRDASGNRIAKPGASCMGCPFVTSCKPAQSYMKDVGLGDDATHERIVAAYAVSQARADALKSIVQRIVDNGAVNVDGGRVGYITKEQRMGKEGAHITLLQHWLKMDDGQFMAWRAGNGDIVKLLETIGVSAGTVDEVAKALYPYSKEARDTYKANRAALAESTLTTKTVVKFDIEKSKAAVNSDGEQK